MLREIMEGDGSPYQITASHYHRPQGFRMEGSCCSLTGEMTFPTPVTFYHTLAFFVALIKALAEFSAAAPFGVFGALLSIPPASWTLAGFDGES